MNEHGNTPLITVVRIDSEHADVVDVLLRGGADETFVGSSGVVAVDFARERGHENTVQLLVNAPIDRRWSHHHVHHFVHHARWRRRPQQ